MGSIFLLLLLFFFFLVNYMKMPWYIPWFICLCIPWTSCIVWNIHWYSDTALIKQIFPEYICVPGAVLVLPRGKKQAISILLGKLDGRWGKCFNVTGLGGTGGFQEEVPFKSRLKVE